jgi:heme exporter protein B
MSPFWSVVAAIVQKDLQAELRSRELLATMLLFALLSVLVFSFALQLNRLAQEEAVAGVLWVTVIFASILGLNRSMAMERENGSMDAMLLAPVHRGTIFLGKLIGNLIFTLTVGLLLLPLMSLLYNMNLFKLWLLGILILGVLGISITGTLLAAMTVQTRAREALLPIVMLPVVLPVMLAAVNATNKIIAIKPVPFSDWSVWLQVLIAVNLIYFVLSLMIFRFVIEE